MGRRSKYDSQEFLGKVYGKLRVKELLGLSEDKCIYYWLTECSCGHLHRTRAQHVISGRVKSCLYCRHQSLTISGFSQGFLSGYRNRAAKKGREFTLTINDLKELYEAQKGVCALSGESLTLPQKAGDVDGHYNVSIDRKNSSLGYTRGNVQLVLKEINLMKSNLTDERFRELCKKVGGSCGV